MKNASTSGESAASSHTLNTSLPRTAHAARLPLAPEPARRATLASPLSELTARGVANGGSCLPSCGASRLWVRIVLSVM